MFRYNFLILVSLLLSNFANAQASLLLAEQLKNTNTIKADFKQTIKNDKDQILQEASGQLMVKRPNKLHWLTQQPYEHLVVTNGKTLWLFDIDLEQVNKEVYNDNIDKAPALLLSGNITAINQHYVVEQLPSSQDKLHFLLSPKASDSVFSLLEMTFTDHVVSSMLLKDNFDQTTIIEFDHVILNQTIADLPFDFIVPEGIEVIENDH